MGDAAVRRLAAPSRRAWASDPMYWEPRRYQRRQRCPPLVPARPFAPFRLSPALCRRSPALYRRSPALYCRSPAWYHRSPAWYCRLPALYYRHSPA